MDKKYEVLKFVDNDFELDVKVDNPNYTVWLTQKQLSLLFNVSTDNIGLHIKNIFAENELDDSTTEKSSVVQKEGNRNIRRNVSLYNLDMIIAVGYRVKSNRGILFRKWANKILKDHLLKGYSINKKRLKLLDKTIEVQNHMLASSLDIDKKALSNVIDAYINALDMLDDYDHQCLIKPLGNEPIYILDYKECRKIIDSMKLKNSSELFGIEKEEGKLDGILGAVYQHVFDKEVYPSTEEKAAYLLYFLVKDHPFVDGCKRIAATLFLEFLNKNNVLVKNGKTIISNDTLVAITLLTAESKPEEKEIIIKIIMNILLNNKS